MDGLEDFEDGLELLVLKRKLQSVELDGDFHGFLPRVVTLMLVHQVEIHGPQNINEELLALVCINHLLAVGLNLLVLTPDLDAAPVRSHNFVHERLHGGDLRVDLHVLRRYLMNDQRVLRIQIDGKAFHFEYLCDLASFGRSVVENGVALSVNSLQVKLTHKDSERGLTNLVAF